MPVIEVYVPVPDELTEFYAARDLMVSPGNEAEFGELATALQMLAKVVALNCKCIATLDQVAETRGGGDKDVLRALNTMRSNNVQAAQMVEFIRVFLGRSQRIGRKPESAVMQ